MLLGGGDGAGEEACGRRRKQASYIRVMLCIHCIFPGCTLQRGVNLTCPTLGGGCWGKEPGSGAACVCELFSRQKLQDLPVPCPLALERAGCFVPGDSAPPPQSLGHQRFPGRCCGWDQGTRF